MEIAKYFDHTNLKADASIKDIERLCQEARKWGFMSVCVNPFYVPIAKKLLSGTDVKVCTVVGFPLGQMSPRMKAKEAEDAVRMGADEVDMVQNIAMAKAGEFPFIESEVRLVKKACHGRLLKVILENCYLDEKTIRLSCRAAKRGGADFVKTSTGFGKGGATAHDVAVMRQEVGPQMGVKAAGGIANAGEFYAMLKAGANRIGSSHSVDILKAISEEEDR